MIYIKGSQAQEYSGDGYSGKDYPITDPDINFATIKITSRSPKSGYQVNLECKELLYILNGKGTLYLKDKEDIIVFNKDDLILIDKGEYYAFDGDFEAAVPCAPAWTIEQHKYTEKS